MAGIEPYCDSDEEVFFGPVTEKEKKIAENIRRRAMIKQGLRSPTSDQKGSVSQDGEEGLHTLAMAAQMLSLSSGDSSDCQEEVTDHQVDNCQLSTVLPPVETITRVKPMHSNDGSHLEMDAVKFLSRHLPEQNHSGFFNGSTEDSKSDFYDSSNVHITSSVSLMDNGSGVLGYWNTSNSANVVDFQQFQNETDECLADSTNGGLCPSNVDVVYPSENVQAAESYHQNGSIDSKVTCMNWDDVNEISKGEFGIKLSDNEEDIEKVERNLKVEEIIKFLADDEHKSEAEFTKESEGKHTSELSLPDSNLPTFSSFDNVNACDDCNDQLPSEIDHDPPGANGEIESNDVLCCTNVLSIIPKTEISPVKVKTEEAESLNGTVTEDPTPSDNNMKKPPMGSSLKKPSATYKRVPTPKYTPGMEKRPPTPRPSRTPNSCTGLGKYQRTPRPLMPLQSPSVDTTTFSKHCARSLLQESTPRQEEGTPFKTPNAKVKPSTGSKIPHLQSTISPLIKSKRFAGIVSPVSQYIHSKPVTLIVNKKSSAVPIPVTHDRKVDAENKPPTTLDLVTPKLQSLPDMLDERDVENVDASNHSTLPEVNFKSALPVKIFSPIASSKTPKSGKTAIVTKHLGHVKIPSTEGGRVPLSFECRESVIPPGEVSLLLSKEVDLHSPQLLRN